MNWALIATSAQPLTYYVNGQNMNPGQWMTTTATIGTIVNLIAYDGVSAYTVPEGTALKQVPDQAQIGDAGY